MSITGTTFFYSTTADDQTFTSEGQIRKIIDNNPNTNTAYGTITWTTTTVTEKTYIPNTANSTAGDTSMNNGFAFNNAGTDGLNSVSGSRRTIPAGVWGFHIGTTLNSPALLATISCTVTAKVYRVATGGGSRTLLFTATSANMSATTSNLTWSSASQPAYTLQAGEVIMVGMTATSASTTALLLGANTNTVLTFFITNGASTFSMPSPGLGYLIGQLLTSIPMKGVTSFIRKIKKTLTSQAMKGIGSYNLKKKTTLTSQAMKGIGSYNLKKKTTLTSQAMKGIGSIIKKKKTTLSVALIGIAPIIKKVKKTIVAVPMLGISALTRRITAYRLFSVAMKGIPDLIRKIKKPLTATSMMGAPTVARVLSLHRTLSTTMIGITFEIKKVKKTIVAQALKGVPTLARRITAFRNLSVTMIGIPTLIRKLTIRRTLSVIMKGIASSSLKLKRTLSVTMIGVPMRFVLKLKRTLSVTMIGVPFVNLLNRKQLVATMKGVPSLVRKLRIARTLAASMKGVPKGRIEMGFEVLDRISGGGTTPIYYRSTFIFDD